MEHRSENRHSSEDAPTSLGDVLLGIFEQVREAVDAESEELEGAADE
jgi:hypothetical protein